MKSFTKVCLMAAGILGILGLIGIGIGLFMGASLWDFRNIGISFEDGELEVYPDFDDLFENRMENMFDPYENRGPDLEERIERRLDRFGENEFLDELIDL